MQVLIYIKSKWEVILLRLWIRCLVVFTSNVNRHASGLQLFAFLFLFFTLLSCEDFVTVPGPQTELNKLNVFVDDATALAAIAGIYSKMSQQSSFASGSTNSITYLQALYADELTSSAASNSTSSSIQFYFNNVVASDGTVSGIWGTCYNLIYSCNSMLEGLDKSTEITSTLKDQLSGEAFFIRAFCHFYLVNLFGDVPLITTSDYRTNAKVSRTPSTQVYMEIISDLLKAKDLLMDNYPSAGRTRPNKGAAIALLARAYLYVGDFPNAEAQATEIISRTSQYKLETDLNKVFLKSLETASFRASEEAIWQLLPNGGNEQYTYEGFCFIQLAAPAGTALRNDLYAAFESGDLRKSYWTDSLTSTSRLSKWYFPYKYKQTYSNAIGTEASMVLRLAEQYLIRAEARAQQNILIGSNSAESDINMIRTRAGLANTTATLKESLLAAIRQERRVELFTEWGHRFFDLKRTGQLDAVLDPIKPNWDSHDSLLPLPQSEVLSNKNLEQNAGY